MEIAFAFWHKQGRLIIHKYLFFLIKSTDLLHDYYAKMIKMPVNQADTIFY